MKSRAESLQIAALREFDILVIGGGIAGAGVAQNAASRGLSVVLIEKEDFAHGTSSRTTKLIHGGLRYLEQFRFKLTRELCKERALLEKLAPHLVRDFSFIMPMYGKRAFFNLKASMGLALYDFLAWSSSAEHHCEHLGVNEVLTAAPALSGGDIVGGLRFHDCITDDSRMVLSVIKSACQEGAIAINYLEASSFVKEGERIAGAVCRDRYSGQELTVRARVCVNATGVWSDQVCQMADAGWRRRVAPSKGIHIIVPPSAYETNTALFLPTDDNRYVFVVPWQRALMIGTTDHAYKGELDNPLPAADEIDYLLSVVNSHSRSHRLNRSDICGSFAGLRPLVQFEGGGAESDTSGMSREHLIFEAVGGLINVAGGKLTSYRLMAEEVVNKVGARLPEALKNPSRTGRLMLGGWADKQDFLTRTAAISASARKLALEPAVLEHLISNYGCDASCVVELVEQDPSLSERICPDFPPIMAEVFFCVEAEMAVCLEDVLFRRLRLGILNQKQCLESAPKVARLMQKLLGWDNYRTDLELSLLGRRIEEHLEPLTQALAQKS